MEKKSRLAREIFTKANVSTLNILPYFGDTEEKMYVMKRLRRESRNLWMKKYKEFSMLLKRKDFVKWNGLKDKDVEYLLTNKNFMFYILDIAIDYDQKSIKSFLKLLRSVEKEDSVYLKFKNIEISHYNKLASSNYPEFTNYLVYNFNIFSESAKNAKIDEIFAKSDWKALNKILINNKIQKFEYQI
jgi:hypothetical protein